MVSNPLETRDSIYTAVSWNPIARGGAAPVSTIQDAHPCRLSISISIGFTTFLFNRQKHPQRRRRCDGGRYYYSTFELPVRATNSRNHSHVPPLPVLVYLPSCPYATQPSIVFPLQSHNSLITVLLRWLHRYTLPAAMLRTWFPSPPPIHPNRSHVHARRRKSKQETKEITSFQLIGNRFQYYRVQNLLLCFPWQFFIHHQHGMRWSATSL